MAFYIFGYLKIPYNNGKIEKFLQVRMHLIS